MDKETIVNQIDALVRSASKANTTTNNLRKLTRKVADWFADELPNMDLPRRYSISAISSERWGEAYFLDLGAKTESDYWETSSLPCGCLNSSGESYLWGDFHCPGPDLPDREACLTFAADLGSGWLEEVSEMLSKRAGKNESAIRILEATSQAIEESSSNS